MVSDANNHRAFTQLKILVKDEVFYYKIEIQYESFSDRYGLVVRCAAKEFGITGNSKGSVLLASKRFCYAGKIKEEHHKLTARGVLSGMRAAQTWSS